MRDLRNVSRTGGLTRYCCLALAMGSVACGGEEAGEEGPSFAGRTYLLTISSGDWDGQLGSEVADSVPQFALQVEQSADGYLVTLATAWEGVQETCNPTQTLPATSSGYPGFQLGPADFPLYIRHPVQPIAVLATARSLSMTDILPDAQTPAEHGTLRATLDAREIYPLFVAIAPAPTADRLCAMIADQDAGTCSACPEDGAEYCLELSASYLGAEEANDFELAPVASMDASCLELEGE